MVRNIVAALASSWVLLGCQHGAASASAQSTPFQPTGSIAFNRGSASFDATRVVGPRINVTMRSDGTWAGNAG